MHQQVIPLTGQAAAAPDASGKYPPAREHFTHLRQAFLEETYAYGRPQQGIEIAGATLADSLHFGAPRRVDVDPFADDISTDPKEIERKRRRPTITAAQAIHDAFREYNFSLDELTPHRIKIAWRIVREIGRLCGALHPDELLEEALETDGRNPHDIDQWYQQRKFPTKGVFYRDTQLQQLMTLDPYTGLLPPHLPMEWRQLNSEEGVPNNAYDYFNVEHDPALHKYTLLVRSLYLTMGMEQGSERWPEYGTQGFMGLDSPDTIRMAFPTKAELMAFERVIVQRVLEESIKSGTSNAIQWIKNELGLTDAEAIALHRMARVYAGKMVGNNADEDLRIMVLKLENIAARARDALDLRTELLTLKQLAIVQGITRIENGDIDTEIATFIRKWDKEGTTNGRKVIGERPAGRQLPPQPKQIQAKVTNAVTLPRTQTPA